MLAYKPALDDTLARLRAFYARSAPDRILARFEVPSLTLADFAARHQAAFCEYPDPEGRAAFWDRLLGERARLEDDSIPVAYLSEFDQGLYAGRGLAQPDAGGGSFGAGAAGRRGQGDHRRALRLLPRH